MEKIQIELLEIAKTVIEIILDNSKVLREYQEKTELYPAVQLFGSSQAGKSTLISCLTLGEQWVPIGTGTATTAVKIELLSVDFLSQAKAQIKWLTKEDLLQLVQQAPMDVFIQAVIAKNKTPFFGYSDISSNRKILTLDSPEDRKIFREALALAKKERLRGGEVGEGETLKVVETILSHYDSYLQEFIAGDINIKNIKGKDLSQLLKWTRRPCDWEVRSVSDYEFDELRNFFIKEVRLYVPTEDAIKGLRILDTPGFGVSLLHNSICREAQRESKAIILVLDSQLTLANLDEIKQLKTGIGSDNIFVIWNQKSVTKPYAERLLDLMLQYLKLEANIIIPRDRVAIVNLHLALRAMQSKKIVKGIDFLCFSNDYPDTFAESLDSSGWNDVIRLFKVIQGRIFAI